MKIAATKILKIGVIAGFFATGAISAQTPAAQSRIQPVSALASKSARQMPLDRVPANYRDQVARIIKQPTIVARAAPEEFPEGIYNWLLEHPDRASSAWRRLGIPCAQIVNRGQGRFGWVDGQGTDIYWRTVYKGEDAHIWMADGQAKLGPLLPVVPVRAVAVLFHDRQQLPNGARLISQSTEIFFQTDSKAAAVIARIVGPAAPRLSEQGASQLLLFFSGLTRYFEHHPEDIESLLAVEKR